MEGGVEDRHLRHPRARRKGDLDPLEVAGVVQGGKGIIARIASRTPASTRAGSRNRSPPWRPGFPMPNRPAGSPIDSRRREVGHHPHEAFPVIPDRRGPCSPIRSTTPARNTATDSIWKSRYLIDELPEFRTRTFNAVSSPATGGFGGAPDDS